MRFFENDPINYLFKIQGFFGKRDKSYHVLSKPKFMFEGRMKKLTTLEKFGVSWNESHPDFQFAVSSFKRWMYNHDEDLYCYNIHWGEYKG